MSELVLHHYDLSPYAEKIRLAFGLKGLGWRSVQIPIVMPKPDLTELTGGYRRTPVLQIGADIYCDTKCITRRLDRLAPTPPLYPPGEEATLHAVARWGETVFMMLVTIALGSGTFDRDFIEDRKSMAPPGVDINKANVVMPTKCVQVRAHLDVLERQLSDGRRFVLGAEPNVADLAAYHPLRFLPQLAATRPLLAELRAVSAWMERVEAIGHGKREEMEPEQAIAVAREATPATPGEEPVLPPGFSLGEPVVVLAEEHGSGPVSGALEASGLHEIAVRRHSERAGELVVHFPREEYLILHAG